MRKAVWIFDYEDVIASALFAVVGTLSGVAYQTKCSQEWNVRTGTFGGLSGFALVALSVVASAQSNEPIWGSTVRNYSAAAIYSLVAYALGITFSSLLNVRGFAVGSMLNNPPLL